MTGDTRIGTLFAGKYQIESRIGRGGMGVIYRGTHVRLGKPVAVKVINPDLDVDADMAVRFEREARAAASLSHPNIATIHDLGQLEDGTLYIAMEFIEGETLKALIMRDGPLSTERVGLLFGQIVSALSVAHRAGIVHRDLKPQNVMVTTAADGREMSKLLDFGIAKSLDDSATQLTATGLSLGTPQYMAPEQAGGGVVDARSDIYSLGVILYEMLTGLVPFDDPSTPAVLVKHLSVPPPRFAERRPDLSLPADLEAIALRCLEKEPARRFQSADDLLATLLDVVGVPATAGITVVGPAAAHQAPAAPGTLDRGDDLTLPPKSALRNLTSVGSGMHMPADAREDRAEKVAQPVGSSIVLVVMVLLLVGGVGFAAFALGYFTSNDADAPRVAATVASESSAVPSAPETPPVAPPAAIESAPATPSEASSERVATPAAAASAAMIAAGSPGPATPPGSTAGSPEGAAPPRLTRVSPPAQTAVEQATPIAPVTSIPAPPVTTPPAQGSARPEHPTVRFGCDGPTNVCVALSAEVERALGSASMPAEDDEARADVLVDALVVEGRPRVEQSFGTTFTITPYTITLSARGRQGGARVPMPESRSFSMDDRVGQARLAEQARLSAQAVVARIQAFWSAK